MSAYPELQTAIIPTRPNFRPSSLHDVACQGPDSSSFFAAVREFMDEFYSQLDHVKRSEMLQLEPAWLPDPRLNAYVAAIAEHLGLRYRLPVPDWSGAEIRFLKSPWFPAGLESLKALAIVESPTAFRRRLIFVDSDPLYRPRRDKVGIG